MPHWRSYMNDILVLYPRPQKVKYYYSDCNITDHLQERKVRSSNKSSSFESQEYHTVHSQFDGLG